MLVNVIPTVVVRFQMLVNKFPTMITRLQINLNEILIVDFRLQMDLNNIPTSGGSWLNLLVGLQVIFKFFCTFVGSLFAVV